MTGALINHVWQSSLFCLLVWILVRICRDNRASLRHWLWVSASLKFLLPVSLLMSLGGYLNFAPAALKVGTQIAAPAVSLTLMPVRQATSTSVSEAPDDTNQDWPTVIALATWTLGLALIARLRIRQALEIRDAVGCSTKSDLPDRPSDGPIAQRLPLDLAGRNGRGTDHGHRDRQQKA